MPVLHLSLKSTRRKIPVIVGTHLWDRVSAFIGEEYPRHKLFVISDSHVGEIYRETATRHLNKHAGFTESITFPAGEANKCREQKAILEDTLLKHKAGRDTLIIALGGGVTGDLAGFVAATLHRGIPYVQLPTSLLAQVDSSIGGKVGINHPLGKNLLGSFYQPEAVFTDIHFLQTLPPEEFLNGMGEVFKYALIFDPPMLEILESEKESILQRSEKLLAEIVLRCIRWKIRVVETDEKETGYRTILNFGHTAGHAIEKLSGYQVRHGFAIAAGMKIALQLSQRLLGYPENNLIKFFQMLENYGLNTVSAAHLQADALWEIMQRDKKARQQNPRFTLIDANGSPRLFHPVSYEEFKDACAQL
ncbi:MAG: 3-dehydroquinate synthase [Calditrichia bacterium]